MWEIVEELRADGVTVVLTTHLMDEAERLADDVVIIDAGRVVAAGPTTSADDRRRRGLADASGRRCTWTWPACSGRCRRAAGRGRPRPGGTASRGPSGPALLATVTAWCAQHGVMPEDLRIARRTLEDVFLDLTGRELRP